MQIAVMAAAGVIALLTMGSLLLAYLKGKGQYDEITDPLDPEEFRLKDFLCAGLFLQENVPIISRLPGGLQEYLRRYDGGVTAQITELYGMKERDDYCAVQRANKWILSLLLGGFLAIFALICCSTGDSGTGLIFAAAAPVGVLAAPFLIDGELKGKIDKRREQIVLEFPEFANKLILLVNAGSTIPKAWEKIVADSASTTPLFRELRACNAEIQAGKPEAVAYEEFGRRCKVKEVIKFVSVIILNLRKGGSEVIPTLRAQSDECWEARKAAARRLGEQASSKLLGPMAVMLLGIIMIVALPAILALTGM